MKARVTRGEVVKFIDNAVNFKGYLSVVIKKGIGEPTENGCINWDGEGETWEEYESYIDLYRPYFDNVLIAKDGGSSLKDEIKNKWASTDIREIPDHIQKYLIRYGNFNNIHVEDMDIIEEQENKIRNIRILNGDLAIELTEARFGLFLVHRVDSSIFNLIRKYGTYWTEAEIEDFFDDMDDFEMACMGKHLKGWYFSNEILDVFVNNKLKYVIK